MRPEDVPEELVRAALLAAVNTERRLFGVEPVGSIPESVGPDTRLAKLVTSALAAVLPLAVAEEREACAKVAEALIIKAHTVEIVPVK